MPDSGLSQTSETKKSFPSFSHITVTRGDLCVFSAYEEQDKQENRISLRNYQFLEKIIFLNNDLAKGHAATHADNLWKLADQFYTESLGNELLWWTVIPEQYAQESPLSLSLLIFDIQETPSVKNNCYCNWQTLLDWEVFLLTSLHLFNTQLYHVKKQPINWQALSCCKAFCAL